VAWPHLNCIVLSGTAWISTSGTESAIVMIDHINLLDPDGHNIEAACHG